LAVVATPINRFRVQTQSFKFHPDGAEIDTVLSELETAALAVAVVVVVLVVVVLVSQRRLTGGGCAAVVLANLPPPAG